MRGGEEGGSGIRSVKIIKRQKEQTFPIDSIHKSSTNFPVFSRVILRLYFSSLRLRRAISLLLHLLSLPPLPVLEETQSEREKETRQPVLHERVCVCVTFKLLAVQVDFYLNEVSTGIDPGLFLSFSLSSPLSLFLYILYIHIHIYI